AILLPNTYFIRQLIDETCQSLNFTPEPVMEMTTMESIINMVSNGVGITILPKAYLNYINNIKIKIITLKNHIFTKKKRIVYIKIKIIQLKNLVFKIEICIVYRKNKYLYTASSVFIDQLVTKIKKAELPD